MSRSASVEQRGLRSRPILVTGATGYLGGRLVPRLLKAGLRVRCIVRSPDKLASRVWSTHPKLDVRRGDVADRDRLTEQMKGCGVAYYLIHSMLAGGPSRAKQDRVLAENFARAAEASSLERIIYAGGLGETGERLPKSLIWRRDVAAVLSSGSVPVTTLRVAMIIGAGSASFEILRYVVERHPIMLGPRWVRTETQPIAVRNVLEYLIGCLEVPETTGRVLDIGGPEVISYRELMRQLTQMLELPRRIVVPVPVVAARLSALWIHMVSPLSYRTARPLLESLHTRGVCRNDDAARLMPRRLLSIREAITRSLRVISEARVETSWSDAGAMPGDPDWAFGTTYRFTREIEIEAPAALVFGAVCRIGGGTGWYAADYLWRLRGFVDRLLGGPGLRRGRRHPESIGFGDALDFWRVTGIQRNRRLALRAEMKLPGEALLEFTVLPSPDRPGPSLLRQDALFKPHGLAGILYWYLVLPFHGFVFRGMLNGIRRTAENAAAVLSYSARSSRETG